MTKQKTIKWYQSKTIKVAIVTGCIGIVTAFSTQYPELGLLISAKAVLDILLRLITTTTVE